MQEQKRWDLRQPWIVCVLLVCLIPVVPEYICVPLSVFTLFLAYKDCQRYGLSLRIGSIAPWLLAYIAFMALSSFFSDNPWQSLATAGMWAVAFCTYATVYSVIRDRERLSLLLDGIAVTAGLLGLLATLQYLCNHILLWPFPVQFWSFLDNWVYQFFPMDMINMDGLRPAATFNNSNVFACYLVLAIPVIFALSLKTDNRKRRLWLRIFLLTAVAGIAFSFSRGAYLALIAVVLLFVILTVRRNGAVFLSMLSVCLLIPQSVINRFTSFSLTDVAVVERLRVWLIALHNIARYPLLGIGAGVQNTWDMMRLEGINAPHCHNLLLQILCEGGVLALTLLAFPLGIVWNGAKRLKKNAQTFFLGLLQQAWVVSFCVYGLADFPLLNPKNVTFFLMLLAVSDVCRTVFFDVPAFQMPRRLLDKLPHKTVSDKGKDL